MKIIMGCDHVGFRMKQELRAELEGQGHTVEDVGTFTEERTDYPIYGKLAGEKLAAGEADRAVLVCGTGFGISLAANKIPGVRCVNCTEPYTAKLSRAHNDANGIALGARVVGIELAKMIVKVFLETEFEGGRHTLRVQMIEG
jgi:ribose 5-phosphate isomerase B